MTYKQRDVVYVPFIYSDYSGIKTRPAIIISNDAYNSTHKDVIVVAITSTINRREGLALNQDAFESGVLPQHSAARPDAIRNIDKRKITRHLCVLSVPAFDMLIERVNALIKRPAPPE